MRKFDPGAEPFDVYEGPPREHAECLLPRILGWLTRLNASFQFSHFVFQCCQSLLNIICAHGVSRNQSFLKQESSFVIGLAIDFLAVFSHLYLELFGVGMIIFSTQSRRKHQLTAIERSFNQADTRLAC